MATIIRSEDDAYRWLESYLAGEAGEPEIALEDWPRLTIRLTGEHFNRSLTPSVMKGFIELQAALNRSYALTVYGHTDTRRLSQDERDQLEFDVEVEPGSSVLTIDLQQFFTSIAGKVVTQMDPVTLTVTILGTAAIWGGVSAYKSYLNHRLEVKKQEASTEERQHQLDQMRFMSEEETKRSQILADVARHNPNVDNAKRIADDARADLLKSFSRAETAEIGDVSLDSEEARYLVKNARRESEEVRLDGNYRILRNDTQDPEAFKVKVRNVDNHQIFEALVQDDSITNRIKAALQKAEWDREVIYLRINAKSLDGDVRKAVVIGVGSGVDEV